jgi:hypothetical protein
MCFFVIPCVFCGWFACVFIICFPLVLIRFCGLKGFVFFVLPCVRVLVVSYILLFCLYTLCLLEGGDWMAKLRLFVRVRKQGSRIESIPLKQLVALSGYDKKRWEFKDGWLILEAF